MRNALLSVLLLLVFSAPAYAQNQAAFCKLWFTHKNVKSADYEAGVDAKGKPVTPADLNDQSGMFSGDAIRFPLTVDLAEKLKSVFPDGTEMQAGISMISISRNGKVSMNDTDISDSAYEVCTGEKPPVKKAAKAAPEKRDVTPAEVPLVKAPQKPSTPNSVPVRMKEPAGSKALKSTSPVKTDKSQLKGEEDIIWGKGY